MPEIKPQTYILFGATGDLAQRKIIPALFCLYRKGLLPTSFSIIAFSRRPWNDAMYRTFIRPLLLHEALDERVVDEFLKCISYIEGVFDRAEGFEKIYAQTIGHEVYMHLAIQPEFYVTAIESIAAAGMRGALLIEKPFGESVESARALEVRIEKHFPPDEIYRIDHYLGKAGLRELVQERQTNVDLENALHTKAVASIAVSFTESIGVAERGEFYDAVGVVRDVVQNHALSMLTTVLMDLELAALSETAARAAVLRSLQEPEHVSRGQYIGYEKVSGVAVNSQTETAISFETTSSLARWEGVPIIVHAGKAFNEKRSEISILFKSGVQKVFDIDTPKSPDAYETVIRAALSKDKNFFQSFEEVEVAWNFADALRASFRDLPVIRYKTGDAFLR